MKIEIYTDGGSRGNPGIAGAGFAAYYLDEEKKEVDGHPFFEEAVFLGEKTNNEAEYLGFLASLKWLSTHKFGETINMVVWKLDSKLVVEQLNKKWKIKEPRLAKFAQEAWSFLSTLPHSFTITHIPREQNSRADKLANQAMDLGS
ncbi:MAG: ribonuclease HI family protein [Patescibacteria group bacterium]